MFQITDVIKHLLIINLIVYFGAEIMTHTGVFDSSVLGLYYPASVNFQPFQLVSHMFMHGGIAHLFFNMLALVMLGPYVEHYLGGRRFLTLYLVSGFGAMGLHVLVWYFDLSSLAPELYAQLMQVPASEFTASPYFQKVYPVVGASGAVYGVLAAFAFLFPNTRLMLLFPPIPIKAKYLVAGLIAFDLFSGISGTRTGIAHFAHVGGALFGFLTLLLWRSSGRRS
jgi:membrane associated rhomboid family serine protease